MDQRRFPVIGDDIKVKWILEGSVVWWPATVLSVDEKDSPDHKRLGKLLYHKVDNYEQTETPVLFMATRARHPHRFVRMVEAGSALVHRSEAASWLFSDEPVEEEKCSVGSPSGCTTSLHPEDTGTEQDIPVRTPHDMKRQKANVVDPKGRGMKTRASISSLSRIRNKHRGTLDSPISKSPRTSLSVGKESSRKSKPSKLESETTDDALEKSEPSSTTHNHDQHPSSTGEPNVKSEAMTLPVEENKARVQNDQFSFEARLRLVERQMQDVKKSGSTSVSETANSVIVSLKWALLKALEKPLKSMPLEDLSKHGIASTEIIVTSHCDYFTFRELSALLEKEHNSSGDDKKSRIAFSPPFSTTQAGSGASDNMNIMFSCLADLTSFLNIRDENDFAYILSKEIITESSTMLRIIGNCKIEDPGNEKLAEGKYEISTETVSNSTDSISAAKPSVITLFVGSAPVKYEKGRDRSSSSVDREDHFRSTLLRQQCRHFSTTQKCYQAPWTLMHMESDFAVDCMFHLDGSIVAEKDLRDFFLLTWTRQTPPSLKKWTRDIHCIGNNVPGSLRLSIPYLFIDSARNVHALVSLLDTEIETFIRLRSTIHNFNSSK